MLFSLSSVSVSDPVLPLTWIFLDGWTGFQPSSVAEASRVLCVVHHMCHRFIVTDATCICSSWQKLWSRARSTLAWVSLLRQETFYRKGFRFLRILQNTCLVYMYGEEIWIYVCIHSGVSQLCSWQLIRSSRCIYLYQIVCQLMSGSR